jgi:hypothetical protein
MKTRRVRQAFAALAVAAAVGGLSQSATASVVLINSVDGASADGSVDISDTQWAAQTFTTTASDYVLDLLSVRLYNNGATAGDMAVSIYDATGAGGTPGSFIRRVFDQDVTSLGTSLSNPTEVFRIFAADPYPSRVLSPSTTYYVVIKGSGITGGTGKWTWTNTNTGTGVSGSVSSYSTDGSTWGAPQATVPLQLQVTAVPEPSGLALAAIAGSAAMGWRQRKRVRSARSRRLQNPSPASANGTSAQEAVRR